MSSNDQMNTKPTIETVLERIETLRQELRSEMRDLRMEMAQGFHKLERKLGVHGSL